MFNLLNLKGLVKQRASSHPVFHLSVDGPITEEPQCSWQEYVVGPQPRPVRHLRITEQYSLRPCASASV
jgi:hypothetical protein